MIKGSHHSEESKKEMSKTHIGKHLLEETKRKIGEARKGRKHSKEAKRKISERRLTQQPPMLGKTHSEETKRKMSKVHKGHKHSEETKRKLSDVNKGKQRSKEIRRKISETLAGKYRGEKSSQWRGGVSSTYLLNLTSRQWDRLRKQCYKRDNYTCQICGETKTLLHAHHIVPWRFSKDDSLENLITLCKSCHGKEERRYYKSLQI